MPKTNSKKSKGVAEVISLRLGDELIERIKWAQEAIQASRGSGAKEVTRTEAIQILVEKGLEQFKASGS